MKSKLVLILFALALVGCKKSGPIDPNEGMTEEQISVAEFISSFSDLSTSPEFKDQFVKPPSSTELKKFRNLYFSAVDIQVNGNSATATVEISKPGEAEPMTTKTWKLVKEGELWKIESAPID